MVLLRANTAVRAARTLRTLAATPSATTAARPFSVSSRRLGGDAHGHHESPYDPPSGYLFGIKPGEKHQKEGWENLMFYGFVPSCLLLIVALAFKPDTSLDTWALEEARRRLEAEGLLVDPHPEHVLPVDEYTSTREGKHPPV
ncbi:unnamed protein product [Parascedosporium putredinis]|uniref:NADH dehydrogenase [ubiquinone] 1 beta subcomplex subunit 11, mitochondrial n=1 Tax=Parascedosporium putredinis TaxID=1442378 RepID=A0A9P1MDX2_9PEZI|nr:unnamed protein product [Parascedosporium putredinis]CAI8004551.1 unnamed protein product [Parascedosporium putredinis]